MSRITLPGKLTAVKVKQAKPRNRTYKLSDGHGLYLEIRSNGSKYWRLAYRFQTKQKTLALGVYPVVTLEKAREKTLEAKRLLDEDIDPSVHKKQLKSALGQTTFESIAKEWYEKESGHWSEGHAAKVWQTIRSGALPHLRNMPITNIKARDVLYVVRKVEERGALDVAARVKQRISSIFRYALQVGYTEHNPVDSLRDVLRTRKVQHRKSIKRDELLYPVFCQAIEIWCMDFLVTRATQHLGGLVVDENQQDIRLLFWHIQRDSNAQSHRPVGAGPPRHAGIPALVQRR